MYKVSMAQECACFKKSEYESEKDFNTQREAYQYTNALVELMNEDFCSTHEFFAQMTTENDFVIGVGLNPDNGSCSTGSCAPSEADTGCGTGSCGC